MKYKILLLFTLGISGVLLSHDSSVLAGSMLGEGNQFQTPIEPIAIQSFNSLQYALSDPIYITGDVELAAAAVGGMGTLESPYILEGWQISTNTTINYGIIINGTTKHFVIRDCWIKSEIGGSIYGIYLHSIAEETALVERILIQEYVYGIKIDDSDKVTVSNNFLQNNQYGIFTEQSDSMIIENNTCYQNSDRAILMVGAGSSFIFNNTCDKNSHGIELLSSDDVMIKNNTCSQNTGNGIYLDDSDSSSIIWNLLDQNNQFGLSLDSASSNNIIHHNTFNGNSAKDDGTDNRWYNTVNNEGNYWSYWNGTGGYEIDGKTLASDPYPLSDPLHELLTIVTQESHEDSEEDVPAFLVSACMIIIGVFALFRKKKRFLY